MASNPYATPESDVAHHSGEEIKTSPFTKKGRLSFVSFLGQSLIMTLVFTLLIAVVIGVFVFLSGGEFSPEIFAAPPVLMTVLMAIIYIGLLWVATCQSIKRLHDINLNGWWFLTFFIVIGVFLIFIPGKERPNRFGGWRRTRVWEKVAAAFYVILMIAYFAGIAFMISSGSLAGV